MVRTIIAAVNKVEEWTLVLVLLGLAMLTFVQVFCRYVLNFSFTWMEEVARYLGVFIAFLGASLGVKYGAHFSMDLLYERVKNDRFRHAVRGAVFLVSAVMFVLVAYYGLIQTMKLHQFGARTSVLQVPKYWAYIPIPFFSLFIALRCCLVGAGHFRACARNEPFAPLNPES
jgi:C4-dicarboxylate transporter DctQ subunit